MSCDDVTGCPEKKDLTCKDFQLTQNRDDCFIDSVIDEALNIGAADLNVFKLLGVHEQGLLVDLAANGTAISGGDSSVYVAANAFESFVSEWRSSQKGTAVIDSAYIGYDFGEIKLPNDRLRYGIETFIKQDIATIKIKQSSDSTKRATKIRLERSEDGVTWYGVAVAELPDDDALNTINFKHSVPSRYWRIRPIEFNGGSTDFWGVQALQLIDYDVTSIDDIEDSILMENRNRDYASVSTLLKGTYDLLDTQTELSRFGIELPSQIFYIHLNFNTCITRLGRPIVIGDVIEVPSETQYSPTLEPIKKYLEVVDVGWSTEGYTPGWKPTLLRIIAQPMLASQETQDIFGGLAGTVDSSGLLDIDDGNHPIFQDQSTISETIKAEENTNVPERGREGQAVVAEFTPEQIESAREQGIPDLGKLGLNSKALYTEDAMPPNGADYTQGDAFPVSPTDGDYHRLTYSGLAHDVPPRLYRWSVAKNRWIYLETDRRQQYNTTRPRLQEFLSSSDRVSPEDIAE